MNQKPVNLSSRDITQARIDAVAEVIRGDRLGIGAKLEAFQGALVEAIASL